MSKELLDKLNKAKRQKPNEGDVFAIDLAHIGSHAYEPDSKAFTTVKGPYGYGRIIDIDKGSGCIVEIFDYVGEFTSDIKAIIDNKRMFDPINVTSLIFKSVRWGIIGPDPAFTKEKAGFKNIKLVLGIAPDLTLWEGGKKSPISVKEAAKYEKYTIKFPEEVEERIKETKKL